MSIDALPMLADPAGGPAHILDVEALFEQLELEAEAHELDADLSGRLTEGTARMTDK